MARSNGRLSEKQVSAWFSGLDFDKQRALLGALHATHDGAKQVQINALRRQLNELEGGRGRAGSGKRARKGRRRKGSAAVKYRDPKTGDTWSGRGRMARWLAAKVSAGEKADKYLA